VAKLGLAKGEALVAVGRTLAAVVGLSVGRGLKMAAPTVPRPSPRATTAITRKISRAPGRSETRSDTVLSSRYPGHVGYAVNVGRRAVGMRLGGNRTGEQPEAHTLGHAVCCNRIDYCLLDNRVVARQHASRMRLNMSYVIGRNDGETT
jgi:hypothetical protein